MLLRSGVILPFQFREHKKLLMVGMPQENRNLSLCDLKNVVRAAFGIDNFEFRNKKIDFGIPDDLLLNYLAQRHDLTNFVIEVRLGSADTQILEAATSIYNKISMRATSTKIANNSNSDNSCGSTALNYETPRSSKLDNINNSIDRDVNNGGDDVDDVNACNNSNTNNNNNSSNNSTTNQEAAKKLRISNGDKSMGQRLDSMDIVLPKIENSNDSDLLKLKVPKSNYNQNNNNNNNSNVLQQSINTVQHINQQHYHHNHIQSPVASSNFFPGYNSTIALPPPPPQPQQTQQQQQSQQQQQHQFYVTPNSICFRRRGERMSKDQKEIYVKYLEENPCMLSQRRNDAMLEPYWTKLAGMLNSIPQGAVKNVEEWKQTFDAWRYRVFMYSRYNSKLSGSAAQNPKNYKPLTVTDQRAYAMWTSNKHTTPQDFEKLDMFTNLDESQNAYDY